MIKNSDAYRTIGIVGLAKNTGKTTTFNALIEHYRHETLGLTSIGLDGEAIDQVNFLPKPKINVYPGMIVATTEACLEQTLVSYDVLVKTPCATALGQVFLVRILSQGTIMLAGPSTNQDMNVLLKLMKMYAKRIFVDGAFSRMTFSAMSELDGIVLAVGASFSPILEDTLMKTKHILTVFSYPISESTIDHPKASWMIMTKNQMIIRMNKSEEAFRHAILESKGDVQKMIVHGAITTRWMDMLIDARLHDFTLLIDDPTKLLFHHRMHDVFEKLRIRVEVIKPCPILLITINPFSPNGPSYDEATMLQYMKAITDIPVINVKQEDIYAQ
jgi:hypothetical protein